MIHAAETDDDAKPQTPMQTTISETTTHTEPSTSQRRGKIARLPRSVRDQLNIRLDDGQEADDILPWLNALPEVQKVITERFNGVGVSPQNLSAWRQGGFKEWLLQHQLLDSAAHVYEHLQEMGEVLECSCPENVPMAIADQLIAQLSIRLNAFLAGWSGGPLDTQVAMLLKMGQFILKLQQSSYRARRQAIEVPGLVRKAEREYEHEIRAELFSEHMASLRKERAQSEEKPKTTNPKNGASKPAAPAQSSSIKLNQAYRAILLTPLNRKIVFSVMFSANLRGNLGSHCCILWVGGVNRIALQA
jgi:hypothetical protein